MHSQVRRRSSHRCGVFLILLLAAVSGSAQERALIWQHSPDYVWARLFLRHSPFPHPSRDNGYTYQENAADSTTKKFEIYGSVCCQRANRIDADDGLP
ncbi:hypothetical protein L0337_43480 [candidate division KSB1 bacterium]|nr:hypothetical protein [candidate division KSB1 bacterium]